MVELGSMDGALALFRVRPVTRKTASTGCSEYAIPTVRPTFLGEARVDIYFDKAIKIAVKDRSLSAAPPSLFDIAKTLAHFGGLFYAHHLKKFLDIFS
tara:strand:- start:900 stop:1193 length:294 start_codon:yes stop_codon:yes gene_type:complete